MTELAGSVAAKRDQLLQLIAGYGSCAVAFSGGVDSAVVAKAAQLALGDAAVIVTGTSESLAEGELEEAQRVARLIGARHVVIPTAEFDNPDYIANTPDRCYHCKTELYGELRDLAQRLGLAVVVNGANVDDVDDYRPGTQAADEFSVHSPLAECGFTKNEIRQLAADWNLPVADKPSTPCLASRVVYGEEVTPERLHMIDQAEQVVRSLGMTDFRVRYHTGDLARIEVSLEELCELCQSDMRTVLVEELRALGFKFVTLDLEGYRSGSLTRLVSADRFMKSS